MKDIFKAGMLILLVSLLAETAQAEHGQAMSAVFVILTSFAALCVCLPAVVIAFVYLVPRKRFFDFLLLVPCTVLTACFCSFPVFEIARVLIQKGISEDTATVIYGLLLVSLTLAPGSVYIIFARWRGSERRRVSHLEVRAHK